MVTTPSQESTTGKQQVHVVVANTPLTRPLFYTMFAELLVFSGTVLIIQHITKLCVTTILLGAMCFNHSLNNSVYTVVMLSNKCHS